MSEGSGGTQDAEITKNVPQKSYRETVLGEKSPQDFITGEIAELRRVQDKRAKKDPSMKPADAYDCAYVVQRWIDNGVITEKDAREAVSGFGLKPEEEAVFFSETLPKIRETMAKEEEIDKQIEIDNAKEYMKRWGPERLDSIAAYYKKNFAKLKFLDLNSRAVWLSNIERYQTERKELEQKIQAIEDPELKAQELKKILFRLTYFYPSEIQSIFEVEQKFNSPVDLDSLFTASEIMCDTATGKDIDTDKFRFSEKDFDAIAKKENYPDDMESAIVYRRREIVNQLTYQGKNPNVILPSWRKGLTKISKKIGG